MSKKIRMFFYSAVILFILVAGICLILHQKNQADDSNKYNITTDIDARPIYILDMPEHKSVNMPQYTEPIVIELPPQVITVRGIEYSTDLIKLNLGQRGLTNDDIKPLNKMVALQSLYINDNPINDWSPLSELTNLSNLDISGLKYGMSEMQTIDISQIKNLSNLEYLDISYSIICNSEYLKSFKNLRELYISDTNISDLSFITEMTNLETLNISYTDINDISALNNTPNLKVLYLSGINATDFSVLKELTKLEEIYLYKTAIADISIFYELPNLKKISLRSSKIKSKDIQKLKNILPDCEIIT